MKEMKENNYKYEFSTRNVNLTKENKIDPCRNCSDNCSSCGFKKYTSSFQQNGY